MQYLHTLPGTDGRKTYEDPAEAHVENVAVSDVQVTTDVEAAAGDKSATTNNSLRSTHKSEMSTPFDIIAAAVQSCSDGVGSEVKGLIGTIFSGMLVGLLIYPYFIMGNDSMTNVFKYPAIKTMLLSNGNPWQTRTSCTITSCWTILESNVQPWYTDDPVYDMRQIDKNTYTASSCNSLPANYGPTLPAGANYCEICGAKQRTNLNYLIACVCLPLIAFALIILIAYSKHKLGGETRAELLVAATIVGTMFIVFVFSINVWANLSECKTAIAAFFEFTYPGQEMKTGYSIGMYLFSWGTVSVGIIFAAMFVSGCYCLLKCLLTTK